MLIWQKTVLKCHMEIHIAEILAGAAQPPGDLPFMA
jgi:hypothetical protein